mgnify:CR=1 FL=1
MQLKGQIVEIKDVEIISEKFRKQVVKSYNCRNIIFNMIQFIFQQNLGLVCLVQDIIQ